MRYSSTMTRSIGAALVLLLLAACTGEMREGEAPAAPALHCPPPLVKAPVVQLYFGRRLRTGGEVTQAEWQRFLAEEVTPRFPDGLTVFEARGQWRGGGVIENENSKVLLILGAGISASDMDTRIDTIAGAYEKRFQQRSVLRVDVEGCFRFYENGR